MGKLVDLLQQVPHSSARTVAQTLKAFLDNSQFFVRKILECNQPRVRILIAADQFVELEMQCHEVAVLRVLNDEHHQESYDGRKTVHHELPRLGEFKKCSARRPSHQ